MQRPALGGSARLGLGVWTGQWTDRCGVRMGIRGSAAVAISLRPLHQATSFAGSMRHVRSKTGFASIVFPQRPSKTFFP